MSAGERERLARAYSLQTGRIGDRAISELVWDYGPELAAELVAADGGETWETVASAAIDDCGKRGLRLLVPSDEEWPAALSADSETEPLGLWVRGHGRLDELTRKVVAVAGRQAATPYGHEVATALGRRLALAGWTVATLGRFGIDSAAVRGALAADNAPPLVLPLGRLTGRPATPLGLADRVAIDGALVSEHGDNEPLVALNLDRHQQINHLTAFASAAKHRRFGNVRKLPSGRYQASYVGPDGQRRTAPDTFRTKTDADRWLASVETDLHRGGWVDDALGRQLFGDYARGWLRDNPNIGDRWRETCLRNLRLHLAPLAELPLRAISPSVVRDWYGTAMRGTGGKTSIAQSYRFLRSVMNAAVREGAILRNPCTIPGAGADRAKERPTATPAQIVALVDAITPRYRAAVLIAAWGGLRRGEIVGLHRQDVDLAAGTVRVRRSRAELLESKVAYDKDPKSEAGKRTVALPPHILPVLAEHLDRWAGDDRVFAGRTGEPMRGDAIRQAFTRARTKVGMNDFRFHDLRHTGQTLAAATGATLADLKKRLGHASNAAALRYLHAVDGKDRSIADRLTDIAVSATCTTEEGGASYYRGR